MKKELILLFAFAMGARVVVSAIKILYGVHNIEVFFTVTAWNDFYLTYADWLKLLDQGLFPYRDFHTYTYPPLFLYTLYPFYRAGGTNAASIPIILSDAATSPIVYLFARKLTSTRIAFIAGAVYALCPLVLFYEGYLWLSSQPMTFFLMLSIYFMQAERPTASFASYGASVMFKQQALLVFPVFLVWQVVKHKRHVWKGISVFVLIIFIVSLPFLLTLGSLYVAAMAYQLPGSEFLVPSNPSAPVTTGNVTQFVSSPVVVRPCPPTLPNTTTPFACIRYPNPLLTSILTTLGWVSDALVIPFLILAGVTLALSREARREVKYLLLLSMLGFLTLFSLTVHPLAAYYFVPAYALLFSAARTRAGILAPLVASTTTMMLPTGNFTLMMALVCVLAVVMLRELQISHLDPSAT